MSLPAFVRSIDKVCSKPSVRFSICTMVTDQEEYAVMVEAYQKAGFTLGDCEFLCCDNRGGNQFDAFEACNQFLEKASGEFVILSHQDVVPCFDDREVLEKRIAEIEEQDPSWAVLGNAGANGLMVNAVRITHGDGVEHNSNNFPAVVNSLDENFLLVRRSAQLRLSSDLRGFHFYGTDICQNAIFRGMTCYVIDYHLLHKSHGRISRDFLEAFERITKKYREILPNGYIRTTCTIIPTGQSQWNHDRAVYLRLRQLQKSKESSEIEIQEAEYLRGLLGPWKSHLHAVIYALMAPFVNLTKSFTKRRRMFLRLNILRRYGEETPSIRREIAELEEGLGQIGYALQWVIYRTIAPFANLMKALSKRKWRQNS